MGGRRATQNNQELGSPGRALPLFYRTLYRSLGRQHWWPARTRFEVIVGAILTQSAAWVNVERAINNLRRAQLLTVAKMEQTPLDRLERLIRPSGYFRQKARKLKAFLRFLRDEYGGSLNRLLRTPTHVLRERLLAVHGVGPETADSILLYAGNHPVFVVDAYTRRILARHRLVQEKAGYEEMRRVFEDHLPKDPQLYNEYHALLVQVGKRWCRPQEPRCGDCPLGMYLEKPV